MSAVPWDSRLAAAAARLLGKADICGICQEPIGNEAKQIDHITPRARGGKNDLDNLQWSHALCNLWKRDRAVWTVAGALAWRETATRSRECGCGRIIRERSNSCPVRVSVGACWECHDPCPECPDAWVSQAKCGSCGSSMDDDCARATLAGGKCARTRKRKRPRQARQAAPWRPESRRERESHEQWQGRQGGQAGQPGPAPVLATDPDDVEQDLANYVPRADGTGLGRTVRERKRARRVRLKWARRWESIGQGAADDGQ